MKRLLLAVGSVAAVVVATPAEAHLVSTRFGELYSGLLHPLTTLQHLVPWLALGLLGGLQQPQTGRWALLVFPLAVFLGILAWRVGPELPYIEAFNTLTFVLLGGLVALAFRAGTLPLLLVVGVVGLSHGYANAADLAGMQFVLYAIGVALAAYALLTLAAGSTHALVSGPAWGAIAIRALGSWIAAAGLMYAAYLWTLLPTG